MILHIKNFKICLIELFIILMLTSCSKKTTKTIFWNDLTVENDEQKITLEYQNTKGIRNKTKLTTNKTHKIKFEENSKLISIEHNSSFCVKIDEKKDNFQIFIFPNCAVEICDNYYLVKDVENVFAYYVECYDDAINRNYYIFSKDNKIDKKALIQDENTNLSILEEDLESDIAVYNNDSQKLEIPYSGYVIMNQEHEIIMLSTLWDQFSF